MDHQGTVIIETKRLILRPFTIEDAEDAFKNWTNDELVTEFLRWPRHGNLSVTREVLNDWIKEYSHKNFYQWAIELKELAEPIGSISVVEMDEKTEKVQIGYAIGTKWWNEGLTSEALAGIIPFFFERVKVQRLEAQHDPKNTSSGKVMEKNGLTYEGTLRKADWNNQGIVDASMYSLLAEEYFRRK